MKELNPHLPLIRQASYRYTNRLLMTLPRHDNWNKANHIYPIPLLTIPKSDKGLDRFQNFLYYDLGDGIQEHGCIYYIHIFGTYHPCILPPASSFPRDDNSKYMNYISFVNARLFSCDHIRKYDHTHIE